MTNLEIIIISLLIAAAGSMAEYARLKKAKVKHDDDLPGPQ